MCQGILIILILDKPFWEGVKVACVCANRQRAWISEWMCRLCVRVCMWTYSSMINAAQDTGPQPHIECDKCFTAKKKMKINQVVCFSPNTEPLYQHFPKIPNIQKQIRRSGLIEKQKDG